MIRLDETVLIVEEELTLETSVLESFHGGYLALIYLFDAKFL